MTNDNFYLIQQDLQFHAKNPSNFGLPPDLDFVSGLHNPSCGDSVTIGGKIFDKKITELYFQGSGCVISMAMASKLTIFAKNMSLHNAKRLGEDEVEQILKLQLGLNRMKCGILSIMALQKGLESKEI